MKLSKKYKRKLKNRFFKCIAVVLLTLAFSGLAGFFAPFSGDDVEMVTTRLSTVSGETVDGLGQTVVTIANDGAIVCDSIVQGVRDCNLSNGTYTFRVVGKTSAGAIESKDYLVELINYYDDVVYSSNTSLGDSSKTKKMLAVKYHKNLTINSGVTVTATNVSNLTYKKGMYLCVMGTLVNNGIISMTARGTYNQAGENVYLWKNNDDSFEYVPATGGTGGDGVSVYGSLWNSGGWYYNTANGNPASKGVNRALGGGGSGAVRVSNRYTVASAAGGRATSYSGGAGSGGTFSAKANVTGYAGSSTGGAGGNAYSHESSGYTSSAAGGAGNPGGYGYSSSGTANQTRYTAGDGKNGTGGLLVLYAGSLDNRGTIESNGSAGGTAPQGGGGSGAGSINLFYNNLLSISTITANGGAGGSSTGGAGGNGSITFSKVGYGLNYTDKEISLAVGDGYSVDLSKLSYQSQSKLQSIPLTVGAVSYEIVDSSVARVDGNGNVTALAEGKTKLKITDILNEQSTYVYIRVKNGVQAQLDVGLNHTVALKENGSVWAYGLNDKGQLGNGTNDNSLEPTEVEGLRNVRQVSAGNNHSLALTSDGYVYSWGDNSKGQLGLGSTENKNVPTRINELSDIVKIDCYKNISIALSSDGKIYTWGEGYSTIPSRVILSDKVVDISGTMILTENGVVYLLSDTKTPIDGFSNIAKIACGENHYLALSVDGKVYASGDNTYGQCAKVIDSEFNHAIAEDIFDIKAGKYVSVLQKENGDVLVCGNNANGELGKGTTTKLTELTSLNIGEEIECIAVGEGIYSGVSDVNGFVYHTGKNGYGELGSGSLTSLSSYTRIGTTDVKTDSEHIYLGLQEDHTVVCTLENSFNLKTDVVDGVQDNFTITMPGTSSFVLNDKNIKSLNYGKTTLTVRHNGTGKTKEIDVTSAMKMESIVQGIRDADFADGEYEILVDEQVYSIELVNYRDDMRYSLDDGQTSKIVSLGDDSKDYKMLVVKYHKDLTIDKGVTLTATTVDNLTYKKGMYICVLGELKNEGTISMTARGTYDIEGEDVYLWKNTDNTYEYIPAEGGSGGDRTAARAKNHDSRGWDWGSESGRSGDDGSNRGLAGGGSGSASRSGNNTLSMYSGTGSAGTSYSGGSGGGGAFSSGVNKTAILYGYDAAPNGGAGGNAYAHESSGYTSSAAGGAGNTGGLGKSSSGTLNQNNYAAGNGQNGTGGLLVVYADSLDNEGSIEAKGSNGGTASAAAGGGSGGGSVNVFYNSLECVSTITAEGGKGGRASYYTTTYAGNGGNGSVTLNKLLPDLNYEDKEVKIGVGNNYIIEVSKLDYINQNALQTGILTVGSLAYEVEDSAIASVDGNGRIVGIKEGKTKVKITDTTNNLSTYVYVTVKDGISAKIAIGNDFTVALKENGTVWSYGLNDKGQLGIQTADDSNEPVQVINGDNNKKLKDIIDIDASGDSVIALSSSGEVYTWGLVNGESVLSARKVEGISGVEKVSTFNGNFYAIDNGRLFAWGNDYGSLTEINTDVRIVSAKGDIALGENGLVYRISDFSSPLEYLSSISKISASDDHYLFLNSEGCIYLLNAGEEIPFIIKKEDNKHLDNVYEISAGNGTSMAVTGDKKVFVFGNNDNNQLSEEAGYDYAVEITKVQDKEGNSLEISSMEIVSAGEEFSAISDEDGFVYTVGLNNYGQLGTQDNEARTIYTQIGKVDILTDPEELKIPVGVTKDISIYLGQNFNMKTDISHENELVLSNTNNIKLSMEEIDGVDNSSVTNISDFEPNYKLTGNKVGRVCLVATSGEMVKNIWVEVVDSEDAAVSAKVVNGDGFSIVLKSDGTVWSFGKNVNGQLGLGDSENRNEPEKLKIDEEIIDIVAGQNHVLLLGRNGKVYSFGLNSKGQLGTGNTTGYKAPIEIRIASVDKIYANKNISYAVTKDRKVYAWGEGYTKTPSLLESDRNVIDISANYYLADDGIVRQIIDDEEIGLSLNEYIPAEGPVFEDDKVVQMSEGVDHLLLLGESGRVYSYGRNVYGQLR